MSGRIGRKRALSQRWLKSPSGVAHPILRGDEACDETTHSNLPDECIHRASTSAAKFGDNFLARGCKFVDKPVVATMAPTVHFVLPEGAD